MAMTGQVGFRYRFPCTGSKDAFSLVSSWLNECVTKHDKCKAGDFNRTYHDASLPSRVVDVGPQDGSIQPKLYCSKGRRAKWVALSHRWGDSTQKVLRTTRANLEQHQKAIHMYEMPKTFRDAVEVTRALGVIYLWIDSLCIIQDDQNDWKKESATMGTIYQDAHLTILAIQAKDPDSGLFSGISDDAGYNFGDHVELPYYEQGAVKGSFYVSVKDEKVHDVKSENVPLLTRGWVFQEWILSRRSIIFLDSGLIWSCRESSEDELGNRVPLKRPTIQDWMEVVSDYSRTELSYESDRLVALQGMAHSLQKVRTDLYFGGIWTADLPDALLWTNVTRKTTPRLRHHLPSWIWASASGPISFQLLCARQEQRCTSSLQTVCSVKLLGSGDIALACKVKQVEKIMQFEYKRQFDESDYHGRMTQDMDTAFMKRCFRGYTNVRQLAGVGLYSPNLAILLKPSGHRVGWALWDCEGEPSGTIYCIALKIERACILAILALPDDITGDAYHVLYVQKVQGSSNRVRRVGIGVVLRDEWFESGIRTCTLLY